MLLTETRDGYAHRLRGIGHLHEAEDESQAWPDLHTAIRTARKAYQTDGTMPDWEVLGQAAVAIKQATSLSKEPLTPTGVPPGYDHIIWSSLGLCPPNA